MHLITSKLGVTVNSIFLKWTWCRVHLLTLKAYEGCDCFAIFSSKMTVCCWRWWPTSGSLNMLHLHTCYIYWVSFTTLESLTKKKKKSLVLFQELSPTFHSFNQQVFVQLPWIWFTWHHVVMHDRETWNSVFVHSWSVGSFVRMTERCGWKFWKKLML